MSRSERIPSAWRPSSLTTSAPTPRKASWPSASLMVASRLMVATSSPFVARTWLISIMPSSSPGSTFPDAHLAL